MPPKSHSSDRAEKVFRSNDFVIANPYELPESAALTEGPDSAVPCASLGDPNAF